MQEMELDQLDENVQNNIDDVETEFWVDENGDIIDNDMDNLNINEAQNDNRPGIQMIKTTVESPRTLTTEKSLKMFKGLLTESFNIPQMDELTSKERELLAKNKINDVKDVLYLQTDDKDIIEFRKKIMPKEMTLDAGQKAIDLLKNSEGYVTNSTKDQYKAEQGYKKAVIAILNSIGLDKTMIKETMNKSLPDRTNQIDLYVGNKDVRAAKSLMSGKVVDPLAIDDYIKNTLHYGNFSFLSTEQRQAVLDQRAGRPYDKNDYYLAAKVLAGPPLTKKTMEIIVAKAKEQMEMIDAQTLIDPKSPKIGVIKASYAKFKNVFTVKGIDGNKFDSLVANYKLGDKENNKKLIDDAFADYENDRLLEHKTDTAVDIFYERIGLAFSANEYARGADLNATNLRDYVHIMRDLNKYKDLVYNDPNKSKLDKALVDITLNKFYKFGEYKGVSKEILEGLLFEDDKSLEQSLADKDIPIPVENDANNKFRYKLSEEEQKYIDQAVVEDRGPIENREFIGDNNQPALERNPENAPEQVPQNQAH